jgi:hypothetical protein
MEISDQNDFLAPIVTDACQLLQIVEFDTNNYVTTDPRVVMCARGAFSQIESYLNRPLYSDDYVEEYYQEDSIIPLRCLPVETISSVELIPTQYQEVLTNSDLVTSLNPATDYRLERNKNLVIYNLAVIGNTTKRVNVRVAYTGGIDSPEEFSWLYNSLVTQTVANYNRTASLGLAQIDGSTASRAASISSASDVGALLESVKQKLDPYVYYGSAIPV